MKRNSNTTNQGSTTNYRRDPLAKIYLQKSLEKAPKEPEPASSQAEESAVEAETGAEDEIDKITRRRDIKKVWRIQALW